MNLLPKYSEEQVAVSEGEYSTDLDLILKAAATDSRSERDRLDAALSEVPWVLAIDGAGRSGYWKTPRDLYLATERLQQVFQGIPDVYFVDNSIACLRGEDIRGLLERVNASRTLKLIDIDCDLPANELARIRRLEGLERETASSIEDQTIWGLDLLLDKLSTLEISEQRFRAARLWDALDELEARNRGAFEVEYWWRYSHQTKRKLIDSDFVRKLNNVRWVPDSSGELKRPELVSFEQTGWKRNRFLESRIKFKPDTISRLAKEAGLESGVVELLQEMGLTSLAELQASLRLNDNREKPKPAQDGRDAQPIAKEPGATTTDEDTLEGNNPGGTANPDDAQTRRPSLDTVGPRKFVSYVSAAVETEDNTDPDGLEHSHRMDLESSAIEFILDRDPSWQRTDTNNSGFDLYRGPTIETATHWCEVKAMTGTLDDRSVGMSRTQFEYAQRRRDAYWLYVVERAGTDLSNLVAIRDPVGKAQNFMFDRGWRSAADDSA